MRFSRKWLQWISCLAFKNPSQHTSMKRGSSSYIFEGEQPTLEEIRGWGKSFDKLMKSTSGRKLFRDFLRSEFSEENILFWLACEELKKEVDVPIIEEKSRTIYEDYVSILSPREVSLDSRVRDVINRNMVDPTPHTFDEAQIQIYTLMHRDSYPRFLNSQKFKALAQLQDGVSASGSTTESPT
ncbi:regulator of G-protein signaling 17-like [Teleopsis dalmanni]|uniref:regulator of G-protein signaling 17-like n=1 Tax=Teleopsis dalmanni TaxID=139649 RepID=UPI0018CDA8FE|nr:regulator of G-protein signaling 17-like [Teleopsis dalmanni]